MVMPRPAGLVVLILAVLAATAPAALGQSQEVTVGGRAQCERRSERRDRRPSRPGSRRRDPGGAAADRGPRQRMGTRQCFPAVARCPDAGVLTASAPPSADGRERLSRSEPGHGTARGQSLRAQHAATGRAMLADDGMGQSGLRRLLPVPEANALVCRPGARRPGDQPRSGRKSSDSSWTFSIRTCSGCRTRRTGPWTPSWAGRADDRRMPGPDPAGAGRSLGRWSGCSGAAGRPSGRHPSGRHPSGRRAGGRRSAGDSGRDRPQPGIQPGGGKCSRLRCRPGGSGARAAGRAGGPSDHRPDGTDPDPDRGSSSDCPRSRGTSVAGPTSRAAGPKRSPGLADGLPATHG